jgi:DNA polymerase-1
MLEKEKAHTDAYLLLQVHDELVYEIRAERVDALSAKIKEIMESVLSPKEARGVPIIVTMKSGPDWGTMHAQ